MRRLPTIPLFAASPARSSPLCCPSAVTSRLQPHLRSAFNANPQIPPIYRPFSHAPTISNSNSPFRLSSTPQSTPPPPTEPDSEFPENDGEYYSPYKPKRQWPPDMSKLSPKHQFRLERKYRRRSALKYARPKWSKATKLVQWGTIGFVIFYALLFMEWDERGGKPIEEFREYIFGTLKGAFSAPPSQASIRRSEDSTRE
ncbi:hypothetical protein ASPSYDRAFT_57045 [Aspergillus sydowii CBS 593.65]|uniref:Uncharacterized protein n=1 Tax=Aspergillus sydowii CBS 593.65 TaxID=1036612 RepID=A0A1L9TJ56_9EURO|nr:uncharacterized protein ASPSYDRAFT_57045 [Aspergillus sydowii CBS 593.65]OJJ59455.1 hypothetical protein ASPSYDRAFT_57045 [Aspergillus sydowii CBS 593.65]